MPCSAIPLTELELVGYADSLPANVGAKTLPPVFRWNKGDSVAYCVPPLDIFRDELVNPVIVHETEFEHLVAQKLVTRLPQSKPAEQGYLLWSDAVGKIHYVSRDIYLSLKKELYARKMDDAELSLMMGEIEQAKSHALIAFSADDSRFHPLAIMATCAFAHGKHALADAYKKDAINIGGRAQEFDIAYNHYIKLIYPLYWREYRPYGGGIDSVLRDPIWSVIPKCGYCLLAEHLNWGPLPDQFKLEFRQIYRVYSALRELSEKVEGYQNRPNILPERLSGYPYIEVLLRLGRSAPELRPLKNVQILAFINTPPHDLLKAA